MVQAVDTGSDGITLAVNGVSAGLWSQGLIGQGVGCVEVRKLGRSRVRVDGP